jgi:hypothetical protein
VHRVVHIPVHPLPDAVVWWYGGLMPKKKRHYPHRPWSERASRAKWIHQRVSQDAHAALGRLSAYWGVPIVRIVDWLVCAAEGVTMLTVPGELFAVYLKGKPVALERATDAEALMVGLRKAFIGRALAGTFSVKAVSSVPLEEFQRLVLTNIYDHVNLILGSIAAANQTLAAQGRRS